MTSGGTLPNDGVGDRDLVTVVAGLLNTRSDAGHELGLLAVALEVEQLGAAIALQGRDEAAQRAGGYIGQLGAGETGSNKGNQSGGELHLDELD